MRDKEMIPDKIRLNEIDLAGFNYCLPDERIAQHPVNVRDMSKLLVSGNNCISDTLFLNIDEYLPADHLLVFNNTSVVRARIIFKKETGASVELFCIEPLVPSDYELNFSAKKHVTWKCIVGNLKKWKQGKLSVSFLYKGQSFELRAEKLKALEDAWEIDFEWDCTDLTFAEVLDITGHIPLPPYINRQEIPEDICRYQTIYAKVKGSVAAPTAGLHFTDRVFEKLRKKGIKSAEITLHVGAGTFQPVKAKTIAGHEMHCEHFTVTPQLIKTMLKNTGKIIAVGTTSVRTIESLYWIGIKLLSGGIDDTGDISTGQWEGYNYESGYTAEESLTAILGFMQRNNLSNLHASTKIMIIPGYEFRLTNGIITNFHQPGSTLLLLVSAWTGKRWKEIYNYAIDNDFRFLSYGDSSLLLR